MTQFTDSFGRYICEGDSITIEADGHEITATIYRDDHDDVPWQREDGHGEVSDWTTRDKRPGERVLSEDRSHHRFYDFQGACQLALRDGWGCEGGLLPNETRKAYAARAAEHDFRVLKAWCDGEWHYYGIAVTVSKDGVELTGKYDHALWGIEGNYPDSDNSHFVEVANELIDEALDDAKIKLTDLCELNS